MQDFEIALQIAEPFLRSTVMTLDKHELAIIDYLQKMGKDETFTAKELLKATNIRHATLHRKLEYLEQQGFIEYTEEPKRGTTNSYRLTEAGTKVSGVEVKITDDGQWLRDLYPKLDDPEAHRIIISTVSQFWDSEQKEEARLTDVENRDMVDTVIRLHEKEKAKRQVKDNPDWKKRRYEDEGGV
jgi:DNA-binding HxlR family transcriptional regulator